jgi:hypothetical protein
VLEFFDPTFVNLVQRHRVQVVELFPALPNHGDEICFLQLLQVLRHGLACHGHMLTKCRERLAILPMQLIKQTPAIRISQRFENFIDI